MTDRPELLTRPEVLACGHIVATLTRNTMPHPNVHHVAPLWCLQEYQSVRLLGAVVPPSPRGSFPEKSRTRVRGPQHSSTHQASECGFRFRLTRPHQECAEGSV